MAIHQGWLQRQVQHKLMLVASFLSSVLHVLSVMYFRRGELYCRKFSIVHSLAHFTRRQEVPEVGERNSCKGEDKLLPDVQDSCGIRTGSNWRGDGKASVFTPFYWYVGTSESLLACFQTNLCQMLVQKSGNSFAMNSARLDTAHTESQSLDYNNFPSSQTAFCIKII